MSRGFRTLAWREITRLFSVFSQTIFPPVISSFLYIFIFGYSIGRHLEDVQGVPYLEFLIPGLMMMYVIEGSYANASSSLFISRWANNIEELLVSPLSYLEMVTAFLIGGLARSLMIVTGVYLVSIFFVQTPLERPIIIVYFVLLASLTFSSLGMIAALFSEEFEHLSRVTTFAITPLVFFGGVFHSWTMVPEPLQWVTTLNPMFYIVNGLRYGMLGQSDVSVATCAMVIAALFFILFSVTLYLFKIGYKLRG